MTKRDNNGYILITVLLLLLVLTILGIAAINTSMVENVLSGNIRLRERNLSKADAGVEISKTLIERTAREKDIQGFTNIVTDGNLVDELGVTAFDTDTQDLAFTVESQNVTVDIDKMYSKQIPGCEISFAEGGTGISCTYTYYRVNATGSGLSQSSANVGTVYRYVPK